MKLFFFTLFLSLQTPIFNYGTVPPDFERHIATIQQIGNGWYEAKVSYYNPKTYQRSNYSLSVKVESNRVTVIDFGNGGSVHSGFNNSGYSYYGGSLTIQKDFKGQITSASTQVSIVDTNGTRYYDIKIQ